MSTDRRYICIVGSGITRNDAPLSDPDALIWTTVSVAMDLPRADLAFEMHKGRYTAEELNRMPVKAFLVHPSYEGKGVRDARTIPIREMEARFGKVYPGSMSMILAWAAMAEPKLRIDLYGIDMAHESEYGGQRELFLYLVGLLRGQGSRITQSEGSGLSDECQTYGFEGPRCAALSRGKARARRELEEAEALFEETRRRIIYANGFLEAVAIHERSKHGSH